jgi:hypothetical protein
MQQSKFAYAFDRSDDGNELIPQEMMTRIIFFMSWYCTTWLIAARKHKIAPRNNQPFNWCFSGHSNCKGTKAPVIKNFLNRHCRECNGQKFYVVRQWLFATSERMNKQATNNLFDWYRATTLMIAKAQGASNQR